MKFLILCLQVVVINKVWGIPLLNSANNIGPLLPNNLAPTGLYAANSLANGNNDVIFNANFVPNNCANTALANEAIVNTNMLTNTNSLLANEAIGASVLSNTIGNSFGPNNFALSSAQFTPIISEIVPSLQYGDITMAGDLPIGGTIKVCGCFPVYGMINVDGQVPSVGTAVVAESFGNTLVDVPICGNPF